MKYDAKFEQKGPYDTQLLIAFFRHQVIAARWLDRLAILHLFHDANLLTDKGLDKAMAHFLKRWDDEVRELFQTAPHNPDHSISPLVLHAIGEQIHDVALDEETELETRWNQFLRSVAKLPAGRLSRASISELAKGTEPSRPMTPSICASCGEYLFGPFCSSCGTKAG